MSIVSQSSGPVSVFLPAGSRNRAGTVEICSALLSKPYWKTNGTGVPWEVLLNRAGMPCGRRTDYRSVSDEPGGQEEEEDI